MPYTRKKRRATFSQVNQINVTPFVDVMLVLLVIFMITAPLLNVGVPVDLPNTNAKTIPDKAEPLIITITPNNTLFIQESKIPFSKLSEKLLALTKQNKDTTIYIRADKTLSYGFVMKTIGELSAIGFSKVALVSDVKQDKGHK